MRSEVAEARVRAFKVVVADELCEFASGFLAVFVFGHLQFVLDRSKAGFGKRVVVAVVGAAHALLHLRPGKRLAVFPASVLSAAVAVTNQSGLWSTFFHGPTQCSQHERFGPVNGHITAHNSS